MIKKTIYTDIALRITIVFLLSFVAGSGNAQQNSEIEKKKRLVGWTVGSAFHTGALLTHHSYMSILKEKNAWFTELYMAKQADGSQPWHSFLGFPDYGLKFSVISVGSPTYIGKAYTLHPFVKFYLLKNNRRFHPSIGLGVGPAYIEKIFDRHTNYKNTAIGSHINAFLQLQLDLNIRITDNVYAFTGFAFSHFSNGSYKKPNAGINIATAKIGVGYSFRQPKDRPKLNDYEEAEELVFRKWSYRAIMSGGLKRIAIGGDQYGILSMSLEASRKHLAYTRFSGSFDMFYDASTYYIVHNNPAYYGDVNRIQSMKLGIAAGYELLFGSKISANFQLGYYLYAKRKEKPVYQRFTLRYMPFDHIGVQFGLKNHLGKADYIELGCIYRLR